MLQVERHQKLIDYVNEKKNVTTEELSEVLAVSKPTVRRDVDALSKAGLIRKVHGGAVSVDSASLWEIPFSDKAAAYRQEKIQIGMAAARRTGPGDVLILDSGSTTLEVAKNLSQPLLTVLTNDLNVAYELAGKDNVQVLMCGGHLDKAVFTLTGSSTVDFFRKIHVNKLFLGCDALDLSFGLSDRSSATAATKQAMIQAADEVIVVTDSSKFDKKVVFHVCDLSDIDTIVTDRVDERYRRAMQEMGIELVIAGGAMLPEEIQGLL